MSSELSKRSLENVKWKSLEVNIDDRGHLIEFWRADYNEYYFRPQMAYLNWTMPGQIRGPHEHKYQSDYFIFPGPGLFEIYLWLNPEEKRTFRLGADNPGAIIIPPRIIHAYKNISMINGLVINMPNQLYKGKHKLEPEDIVRWEDNPNNPYTIL